MHIHNIAEANFGSCRGVLAIKCEGCKESFWSNLPPLEFTSNLEITDRLLANDTLMQQVAEAGKHFILARLRLIFS